MQPGRDRFPSSVEPEAAVGTHERPARQDPEPADVLRPHLVGPQDEPVFRREPFERHRDHLARASLLPAPTARAARPCGLGPVASWLTNGFGAQ